MCICWTCWVSHCTGYKNPSIISSYPWGIRLRTWIGQFKEGRVLGSTNWWICLGCALPFFVCFMGSCRWMHTGRGGSTWRVWGRVGCFWWWFWCGLGNACNFWGCSWSITQRRCCWGLSDARGLFRIIDRRGNRRESSVTTGSRWLGFWAWSGCGLWSRGWLSCTGSWWISSCCLTIPRLSRSEDGSSDNTW